MSKVSNQPSAKPPASTLPAENQKEAPSPPQVYLTPQGRPIYPTSPPARHGGKQPPTLPPGAEPNEGPLGRGYYIEEYPRGAILFYATQAPPKDSPPTMNPIPGPQGLSSHQQRRPQQQQFAMQEDETESEISPEWVETLRRVLATDTTKMDPFRQNHFYKTYLQPMAREVAQIDSPAAERYLDALGTKAQEVREAREEGLRARRGEEGQKAEDEARERNRERRAEMPPWQR